MSLALTDALAAERPQEGEWVGNVPVDSLPRLAKALPQQAGHVQIQLRVHRSETGVPLIEGSATARLTLECQRCLEPIRKSVTADFRLALVDAGGEHLAPEGYDPFVTDRPSPGALLEDELLLALPLAPVHEELGDCGPLGSAVEELSETQDTERRRPFAVLETLKRG